MTVRAKIKKASEAFNATAEQAWISQGVQGAIDKAIAKGKLVCHVNVDTNTGLIITQYGRSVLNYAITCRPAHDAAGNPTSEAELTISWSIKS